MQFDHVRQLVEDGGNLLAGELGALRDGVQDLGLGVLVVDSRWFLCHDVMVWFTLEVAFSCLSFLL